jgi:hypothetical protein
MKRYSTSLECSRNDSHEAGIPLAFRVHKSAAISRVCLVASHRCNFTEFWYFYLQQGWTDFLARGAGQNRSSRCLLVSLSRKSDAFLHNWFDVLCIQARLDPRLPDAVTPFCSQSALRPVVNQGLIVPLPMQSDVQHASCIQHSQQERKKSEGRGIL